MAVLALSYGSESRTMTKKQENNKQETDFGNEISERCYKT